MDVCQGIKREEQPGVVVEKAGKHHNKPIELWSRKVRPN